MLTRARSISAQTRFLCPTIMRAAEDPDSARLQLDHGGHDCRPAGGDDGVDQAGDAGDSGDAATGPAGAVQAGHRGGGRDGAEPAAPVFIEQRGSAAATSEAGATGVGRERVHCGVIQLEQLLQRVTVSSQRRNRRRKSSPKGTRPPGNFHGEYHPRRRGRSPERRSPPKRLRWRRVAALSPPRQREARQHPPRQVFDVRFLQVADDPRFDPRDHVGATGQETDHILEALSLRFATALPVKDVVDRIHKAALWAFRVFYNTKGEFAIRVQRQRTRNKRKNAAASSRSAANAPDAAGDTSQRKFVLKSSKAAGPTPPRGPPPPRAWQPQPTATPKAPEKKPDRKRRLSTPKRTWPAGAPAPRPKPKAVAPSKAQTPLPRPAPQPDAPWRTRAAPSVAQKRPR